MTANIAVIFGWKFKREYQDVGPKHVVINECIKKSRIIRIISSTTLRSNTILRTSKFSVFPRDEMNLFQDIMRLTKQRMSRKDTS